MMHPVQKDVIQEGQSSSVVGKGEGQTLQNKIVNILCGGSHL